MRSGTAYLPLHTGKAPRWLFQRMVKLARGISLLIIEDFGPTELLRRLSDPFWFQAFGCVLGFDWHSSGVTTTVGGALKEALQGLGDQTGFYVAGGKGGVSRKTPGEIEKFCERLSLNGNALVYASRMSAKVDSAGLQDGYQLYHHNFFFSREGYWCVVQQGMNETNKYARRYHWFSPIVKEFVCEPHAAICAEERHECLNMVAAESRDARDASTSAACLHPDKFKKELQQVESLVLPVRHGIFPAEDIQSTYVHKILLRTYERQPENFETLLGMEGVGPKTIRALSLIGELIYGKKPSFRDPARFSFAHGGKDKIPYPVDRKLYDQSVDFLEKAVRKSAADLTEKKRALERLHKMYAPKKL